MLTDAGLTSQEMIEFWDAGVTDAGMEGETAGDIQDSFHKRYARQTLELDSQGRVKAVRQMLYYIYDVLVKSSLVKMIPLCALRTVKL